jgi:nitrate/nitrite transport system ATP-binding protein
MAIGLEKLEQNTKNTVRAISPDIALSIQNVTKAFPGAKVLALDRINLDIRRGEFVSLIGHSGCGKSTLLNLIAGLYPASSGIILRDGKKITQPGPDRAMVFQQYSLLPWLSVWQNVYEAVDAVYGSTKTHLEKMAMTEEMLVKVGLMPHKKKKPGEISGGMKQRVAIARAFATRPKVLLLDEPFGALDALTKGAMHDEILRLWGNETSIETVVMVTHDIDEAIYLSDRIVVMTNGPAATIGEIIEVKLPRPRDKRAMLHSTEWADLKENLLQLLTVKYAHPVGH